MIHLNSTGGISDTDTADSVRRDDPVEAIFSGTAEKATVRMGSAYASDQGTRAVERIEGDRPRPISPDNTCVGGKSPKRGSVEGKRDSSTAAVTKEVTS